MRTFSNGTWHRLPACTTVDLCRCCRMNRVDGEFSRRNWRHHSFTVKFGDFESIDKRVDFRVLAGDFNTSRIPPIEPPCFNPGFRSTRESGPHSLVFVFVVVMPIRFFSSSYLPLMLALCIKTGRPFPINVSNVTCVMIVDHHLEALPAVIPTNEKPRTDAPSASYQFREQTSNLRSVSRIPPLPDPGGSCCPAITPFSTSIAPVPCPIFSD